MLTEAITNIKDPKRDWLGVILKGNQLGVLLKGNQLSVILKRTG